VQTVVTDTASSILSNVVIIISSLVAMWLLSWKLTILSLALVPLFVFFTYRVGKTRKAVQSIAQQSLADLTAITEETLSVSGICCRRCSAGSATRSAGSVTRTSG